MSVTVTGMRDFKSQIKKLGPLFSDAVDQGVFVTSEEVRAYAVKSIQETSPGRQVQRTKQGGKGTYTHTAAAKNYAPNSDTGKLVTSIASNKTGNGTYKVGSGLDYASWLEFGTKKMDARPWLQPAMRANGHNLIVNISEVVDIFIERLAK